MSGVRDDNDYNRRFPGGPFARSMRTTGRNKKKSSTITITTRRYIILRAALGGRFLRDPRDRANVFRRIILTRAQTVRSVLFAWPATSNCTACRPVSAPPIARGGPAAKSRRCPTEFTPMARARGLFNVEHRRCRILRDGTGGLKLRRLANNIRHRRSERVPDVQSRTIWKSSLTDTLNGSETRTNVTAKQLRRQLAGDFRASRTPPWTPGTI